METYLPAFVGVTAGAVVLQALILVALYLSVRKTTSRLEALAEEVKTKALPTIEQANSLMVDLKPKIETVAANITDTSNTVKAQLSRIDATVGDVLDRTRLQVIRADELLSRTMDRVEETSEMVHRTVISPVRQVSGLVQGLSAGVEYFFGQRRRRDNVGVPQDELFI
jgi:methyl-accepting chemotaxis protein